MSKKILFITNKLIGGGSERVLTTIASEFAKENQVIILSVNKGETYELNKDIKVLFLENRRSKINRILNMRKIIKKEKPDVVISFEYYINMQTCIANLGLKNRLIISERNDPKVKGNHYKTLRNFLYRFANVLVCQTDDAKEYFPRYIQKKSVIILNPLKENIPEPWEGKREKTIVNFCRLEKQKNLKLLVDSFEIVKMKYQDYKLKIFGEGSEKEDLLSYIKNKGLENDIEINPFKNNIHELIKKSSMFVSTSDYEGMSNSMLEAMALGLPTICTDCPCGGARMVIQNMENGILVPVGDREKIAQSIMMILEDKNLMDNISKNALEIRTKCGINKIYNDWKKIVE